MPYECWPLGSGVRAELSTPQSPEWVSDKINICASRAMGIIWLRKRGLEA